MTKTLKERKEELARREQEIRERLDLNSDGLKEKAKYVGKIALISGGVALIGFWIYKAFFENEDEEISKKKSRKRRKAVKSASARIAEVALPYIGKVLDSVFKEGSANKDKKENIVDKD